MTKLSQHWSPQWSGDQNEDLYEVHKWPSIMVVDLGKRTCTCRFWQLTGRPAPVPTPIKPKPGRPTKNRRKDKDEGGSGSKTRMKRKYNPIRCMFCGEVGHNKRTCKLKKQADAEEEVRLMQLQLAIIDPNTDAPNELPNDAAHISSSFFLLLAWTSSKYSYHVSATTTHHRDLYFCSLLWHRNQLPPPSTAAGSATTLKQGILVCGRM
ncbi:hypothetical protein Ahy_A04g020566 [Arachis hypogaea]|uniref:CCHC-type domain-containing protein n=1 Tax=Arachis hypogaea TaxID=3818 RepID=A0A445DI24_ARAHY|nr:hypothetical protein Ahy_A04g020566 [Arachis hypogaea]